MRGDRVAEIAMQDVPEPDQVLVGEDRLVEPEQVPLLLEDLRVCEEIAEDLLVDRGQQGVPRRGLERDEPEKITPFLYTGGISEFIKHLNRGKSVLHEHPIYVEGEKPGPSGTVVPSSA